MKKIKVLAIVSVMVMFCISLTACAEKKTVPTAESNQINYLVLVNKQNKLPDDWEEKVQLETVQEVSGGECKVEKEALLKFYELRDYLAKNEAIKTDSFVFSFKDTPQTTHSPAQLS